MDRFFNLNSLFENAPYLRRLTEKYPDTLIKTEAGASKHLLAELLNDVRAFQDFKDAADFLRDAKARLHLILALGDLAGAIPQSEIVKGLSEFAQLALQKALMSAASELGFEVQDEGNPVPGYFLLAMGKLGAYELNYSSDIDLIALYDEEVFVPHAKSVKESARILTQKLVQIMEERTIEGYVFRTDLRLRPDPGSTQIVVSTSFALNYYEAIGQNWERAAHIKARFCAGDEDSAAAYLQELTPFIWRRHLDYWALSDIHSIKRQIHAEGGHGELAAKKFDVKLGRGGIREIEFYAQTQQLILGGKDKRLRCSGTLEALKTLEEVGAVEAEIGLGLKTAYEFLRNVEHRLQMLNDEQTHLLKEDEAHRFLIAQMMAFELLEGFETVLFQHRSFVHEAYAELFALEERLSAYDGNLVFTGVDDDPQTLETLRNMGFQRPEIVTETVRNWHRGEVRAARSARGRELLTRLTPRLLQHIGDSEDPDHAFKQMNLFLSGISSGVQTLSFLLNNQAVEKQMLRLFALAPQLARDISEQPEILETFAGFDLFSADESTSYATKWAEELQTLLHQSADFEDKLNIARIFMRDKRQKIIWQLLTDTLQTEEAGGAFANLADIIVNAMWTITCEDMKERHGTSDVKACLVALGKYGGQEMTANSDLDIMLLYDADASDFEAQAFYTKFTQRLISALSALTQFGRLYEVDMDLRPSGKAGPVAVKLSAFDKYYKETAWSYEFLALTRARIVTGDRALTSTIATQLLASRSAIPPFEELTSDIAEMRIRLKEERPPQHFWDLKLSEGGFFDIEFIAQALCLQHFAKAEKTFPSDTQGMIKALQGAAIIDNRKADDLFSALQKYQHLDQLFKAAHGAYVDEDIMSEAFARRISDILSSNDLVAARQCLEASRKDVQKIFDEIFGA